MIYKCPKQLNMENKTNTVKANLLPRTAFQFPPSALQASSLRYLMSKVISITIL